MPSSDDPAYVPPPRKGARPVTTERPPHSQVDQLPTSETREALCGLIVGEVIKLAHVVTGASRRAPPGSIGFYLKADAASDDERRFLLGHEFAHVHVSDEGSLHAILPEPLRRSAIGSVAAVTWT